MIVQTNKGRFRIVSYKDNDGYFAVVMSVDDNRCFYTFSINSVVEDIVRQINEMDD